MKCLSLWQPWAEAIFRTDDKGVVLKPDETRGWPTNVRGRVAIHAAKKPLREVLKMYPHVREMLMTCGIRDYQMRFGAIIGTVEIEHCLPAEAVGLSRPDRQRQWGDYRAVGDDGKKRFAFVLKNPSLITAVPCVGRQGFFNVDIQEFERF